jgi:hypothetical protein
MKRKESAKERMQTKNKEIKMKLGSGKRAKGGELILGRSGSGFLLMD